MTAFDLYRQDGEPLLLRSVVLYLDVLGISAASTSDQRARALVQLDRALQRAGHAAMARASDETQALTWFTDNVFVAWPLQQGVDEEMALSLAVRAAAYLQLMLLLDGYASRGGIAYGEVHMSDNFAFGPALVEAHELETQVGRPIVSLSAEASAAARASAASWADPAEAFGEELLLDAADATYVDYLGYAWTDDPAEFERLNAAVVHRDVIRGQLTRLPRGARGRDKWEWLAAYHDAVCARYRPAESALQLAVADDRFQRFR